MILLSELVWLVLYLISIYFGIIFNDILLISISFFILGFSGVEFSIGIIISILYKNFNENINLEENDKSNNQFKMFKNLKNYI